MDSREALEFINSLFEQANKSILNDLETTLFLGIWEGKTYTEICATTYRSEQHLRDAGASLCRKITEDLEIRVTKRNFKKPIEYRYQQHSPKVTPPQEPLVNQTNQTKQETSNSDVITNPFILPNGRVEEPHFFDREREMQRVFEVLNSGSSVALIGEEGIGKSSLLWAICQQAKNRLQPSRQSVFLDLNYIDNEEDFYSALCDEVGIPECKGYQLNQNLKKHKNKVLLALDNVGKLTWQGFTRGVRDKLRGLAEGSNAPLKLILAATEPLNDLFNDSHDEGKTSPLAGICQEEHIQPWDETTMHDFIASRLAGTSVRFTEEEIVQLVAESGGHPRKLMQLCYGTYARYTGGVE